MIFFNRDGGSTVLIIDEAQNLSLEVMEQLRILSNLETDKEKLLQIIFVGQMELYEKLQLPALKQLNQRVSVRYEIRPLSKDEAKNYINHRLLVAGGGTGITFSRASLNEIFRYSRGYPRLINLVCDRTLLAGYNAQTDHIANAHVKQGIRSLLGEEDESYFVRRFFKDRLPFWISFVFFVAGLGFFILAKIPVPFVKGGGVSRQVPQAAKPVAGVPEVRNDSPADSPDSEKDLRIESRPQSEPAPGNASATSLAAPDSSAATAASGGTGSTYRIQVYSLSTPDLADVSVQKLKKEGFPAYWKKVDSGEQSWYVVYLGPFGNIQSARIHLNALKQTGLKPMLFSVSSFAEGGPPK